MPHNSRLHKGSHIVCADRKPALLEQMVDILRRNDHCVFQAFDGLAALELALSLKSIDLLITNTSMPGMRGPELILEVRRRLPAVPILYVKNLEAHEGIPEGLPHNVPILREPFTEPELLAAVGPLLEKSR